MKPDLSSNAMISEKEEKRLRINRLEKERRDRLKRLTCELNRCMFGDNYKKSTYKQTLKNATKFIRLLRKRESELNNEKDKLKLINLQLRMRKNELFKSKFLNCK